ncbi:MAG TPA: DUF5130 family protein [Actinopolymorphaceae bacterium]
MVGGETFTPRQRAEIERSIRVASELSGLKFSVYVGHGELQGDPREAAARLHAALPDPAHTVLVLVDPVDRVIEIRTGVEARRVLSDDECRLAILTMQSAFAVGDLVGGLVNGIQQLGEHARRPRTVHTDEV